jgi:endonuclease-3
VSEEVETARPEGSKRPGGSAPASRRPTSRRRGPTSRRRRPADPARTWARRLERTRPGLVEFVLDALATLYGRPTWRRRLDPTSELVLTILAQNSADTNAEQAFESLRARFPGTGPLVGDRRANGTAPDGWGGLGIEIAPAPNWAAIAEAPIEEVEEAIRPGGLARQKAPRLVAALRRIRDERGDFSLEFLGEMEPLAARDWLTSIEGIGKKTASVILMFCFGMPLMPVDRHVERVSKRIGLVPAKATADECHDIYLELLRPEQVYEAHVNLITHGRRICEARRPKCEACPVAPRCRFVDPKAP